MMRITPKYTSTKDETLGNKLGTIASVEDSATVIPVGIMLSSILASTSRVVATVDTVLDLTHTGLTDYDTSALVVENYPALVLYGKFDTADAAATVYLVYYDSSDVPLFISGPYVLASSSWFIGSDYASNRFLVDTCGAGKVYAYVSSLTTSAAVTVYLGTVSG